MCGGEFAGSFGVGACGKVARAQVPGKGCRGWRHRPR